MEEIFSDGRENITKVLRLYDDYRKVTEHIIAEHFSGEKSKLTARELEVAQLAAAGLTNRESGERLFITENTVNLCRSDSVAKTIGHREERRKKRT